MKFLVVLSLLLLRIENLFEYELKELKELKNRSESKNF